MDLFVATSDIATYFGGATLILLPLEDAGSVELEDIGSPVLLYAQTSRNRAHLVSHTDADPDYRLQVPPPIRPIIAFTSESGRRSTRSLIRWFRNVDPDRAYTPLDLTIPEDPTLRKSALLHEMNSRYVAEHERIARALSETRGEVARLRQDVEALHNDLFECTQQLGTKAFPFRAHTALPMMRATETLGPSAESNRLISQPLPCKARGLAGIDVFFKRSATRDGKLFFDLVGKEDGAVLRSWDLDYSAAEGWVHLPCKEVLKSSHVYLNLTVRWSDPDPGAPALVLTDASAMREAFCRLDDVPVPNRALAFRTWSGPPGEFSKARSGAHWAAVRSPEDYLFLSLPSHQFAAAQPLSEEDKEIGCVKLIDRDQLQIHPRAGRISAARIRDVAIANVEEIRADIHIAHEASPHVEFALAAVTKDSQISNPQLAGGKLSASVVAFSGWQIHTPNAGVGLIQLPIGHLDADDSVDLILATRTHKNVSGACAWARWSSPRLLWRPNRATVVGDVSAEEDKSLALLRERRMRLKDYVRGSTEPLATLVCCLHRQADIKNMAVQLSQQLYLNKEILVVINNENITEPQVAGAFPDPDEIRLIRCKGDSSLGVCLNEAVQNSNGEYFLKIDADDLYFPNYTRDMVAAAVEKSASLIGKTAIFVFTEEENRLYLKNPNGSDQQAFQTAGGTLCIDRKVFDRVMFRTDLPTGTDLGFHTDCEQHGIGVFSVDTFNYVYVRRRDRSIHTWREEAEQVLGPNPILLGGRGEIWRAVA